MRPTVFEMGLVLGCVLWAGCTPAGNGSAVDPDRGVEGDGQLPDGAPSPDGAPAADGSPPDAAPPDGDPTDGAVLVDGAPDGAGPACEAPTRRCGDDCVDITRERAHCGACDSPCEAGEACVDSECAPDDCPAGTHDCGGACVPDDDVATCGDRCAPCPAPEGGAAACVDGACVETCPAGALACDGICAPCAADPADSACEGRSCVCVPDCERRVCGVDPACGEPCGDCADGDDECVDGQCISGCLTPLDGLLTVDVRTVALTVDVTLDGAPLGPENTNPAEYGAVILRDPDSGEDVFRFTPIDADGVFLLPYTVRVVAGRYDVAYQRVAYINDAAGENHWPINDDRILMRGLLLDEDGPLTLDVPTVAPPLDVTLDGAPTTADNTAPNDRGTVTLVDPETGEDVFNLTVMGENGALFLPWAPRVVAGDYPLRYRRDAYRNVADGQNNWPVNDQRVLGGIVLDDDAPRDLNVPTVAPPLDVTLDGAPTDERNTAPDDRGTVQLIDPETGDDVFNLTVMGENGDLFLPWAPRVVAGEYALRYRRDAYRNVADGQNDWPINDQRNLGRVVLDDDAPRAFDVPTVAPLLDVSLDGEATDGGNTSPADRGGIWLMDPQTGEDVFGLLVMGDDGQLFLPWAPRVVAGEYRLQYRRVAYVNDGADPGRWPVNDARDLGAVTLEDDAERVFDVPTAVMRAAVLIDGAEPAPDNTNARESGQVIMRDRTSAEDVFTFTVLVDDAYVLPHSARVVAGRYGAHYARNQYLNINSDEMHWPVNDDRPLICVEVP